MYVVPAVTATGEGKVASCQPLAVSLVKLTLARRVPVLVQRLPTWTPVVSAGL